MPGTRRLTPALLALSVVLVMEACEYRSDSLPTSSEILAMKGGNKPGGKDEIEVRDVDPDTAFQGEVLEVEVSGSGFDPSSFVDFELDGQPTDDITVQSTTFISERKLTADITVDAEAQEDDFDVVVESLSRGKKGIGLELFQVKKATVEVETTFRDDGADHLFSDGGGTYLPGTDGFSSEVGPDVAGVGGASWVLASSKGSQVNREYCVIVPGFFDAPGTCSEGNFRTTQHTGGQRLQDLEEGDSLRARARFFFFPGDGFQYSVRFACNDSGLDDESCQHWVDVTRTATGWTITGQTAGFVKKISIRGKQTVEDLFPPGSSIAMPFSMTLDEVE